MKKIIEGLWGKYRPEHNFSISIEIDKFQFEQACEEAMEAQREAYARGWDNNPIQDINLMLNAEVE